MEQNQTASKSKKILFLEPQDHYSDYEFISFHADFNGIKLIGSNLSENLAMYDAVACSIYHSELMNYIINRSNTLGILTILIADGIFDWANATDHPILIRKSLTLYHPIIHDIFLCIGKKEKMYFESNGTTSINFMPKNILSNKKKHPLPAKPQLLLTTANTPYFNKNEFQTLIKTLKDLSQNANQIGINYKYRIFDEKIINHLNIKPAENDTRRSFEVVIKDYTYVITTPSSIALTSMHHGRAVGQILYRNTPIFVQSGWNILPGSNTKLDLLDITSMNQNRMAFQRHVINQYDTSDKKNDLESALIQALGKKKREFGENTATHLLESPLNFNFEYFLRKTLARLRSNGFFSKTYKLLKSIIYRAST